MLALEGIVGQMRSRNRSQGLLATLVVVAAIGLIALGYLAGVSGWLRIGRPNHASSPTPTASLQDVIDRVQSSAVTIDTTTLDGDSVGSGFVSASGGVVLTNAHVVEHAFRVVVVDREGNKHPAHVIGLDSLQDIAALKVTGLDRMPLTLTTGSGMLKAGTEIYVVGNPGGTHPNSVLKGLVSATGLNVTVQGVDYHGLYQLDTSNVVSGNSGSPIITSDGQVVGMDALGDIPNVAVSRFAYAIPVATFRQEAEDWGKAGSPVPVNAADLPWQTDPKQSVVQLPELRAGYTRTAEGPAQFSGTSAAPPSDEVTFVLPAGEGRSNRQLISRVIVYNNRVDAVQDASSEHTQLLDAGAAEQQSAVVGEQSYVLTQTATDGTMTVAVIWRDRNVSCLLRLDGITGSAAVQMALDLANGVEHRVTSSPTVNPDAP